jgi:hypothetical protein
LSDGDHPNVRRIITHKSEEKVDCAHKPP